MKEKVLMLLCCIRGAWRYVFAGFAMSKLMIFVSIGESSSVAFGFISLIMIELFAPNPRCTHRWMRAVHHAINLLAGLVGISLAVLFHQVTGLHLHK